MARLVGHDWTVSLDESPELLASLRATCPRDGADECLVRVRAQSARERIRFERSEDGAGVQLSTLDGDALVKRATYDLATSDGASFTLAARGADERISMTLLQTGNLRVATPKLGSVTYRPEAVATQSEPSQAPVFSRWTELALEEVGRDDWRAYKDAPRHTAKTVIGIVPGDVSPEAALTHYLASRIRKDARYREVIGTCNEHCKKRLDANLSTHDGWTFLSFHLVGRADAPNGDVSIKAHFRIRAGNKEDEGTDVFVLRREGRRWLIVAVPT